MEYIKVTNENIEKEHICCAISNDNDIQVSSKKAWLSERFEDGLVFLKSTEKFFLIFFDLFCGVVKYLCFCPKMEILPSIGSEFRFLKLPPAGKQCMIVTVKRAFYNRL